MDAGSSTCCLIHTGQIGELQKTRFDHVQSQAPQPDIRARPIMIDCITYLSNSLTHLVIENNSILREKIKIFEDKDHPLEDGHDLIVQKQEDVRVISFKPKLPIKTLKQQDYDAGARKVNTLVDQLTINAKKAIQRIQPKKKRKTPRRKRR